MAARADRGRLRASHADRNQVVDVLKAAFIEGRLTKDELDARLGQTLAARTYAELAALTADIPPGTKLARQPQPDRAPAPQSTRWVSHRAVKSGAVAIGGIALAVCVLGVCAWQSRCRSGLGGIRGDAGGRRCRARGLAGGCDPDA